CLLMPLQGGPLQNKRRSSLANGQSFWHRKPCLSCSGTGTRQTRSLKSMRMNSRQSESLKRCGANSIWQSRSHGSKQLEISFCLLVGSSAAVSESYLSF